MRRRGGSTRDRRQWPRARSFPRRTKNAPASFSSGAGSYLKDPGNRGLGGGERTGRAAAQRLTFSAFTHDVLLGVGSEEAPRAACALAGRVNRAGRVPSLTTSCSLTFGRYSLGEMFRCARDGAIAP